MKAVALKPTASIIRQTESGSIRQIAHLQKLGLEEFDVETAGSGELAGALLCLSNLVNALYFNYDAPGQSTSRPNAIDRLFEAVNHKLINAADLAVRLHFELAARDRTQLTGTGHDNH